jgi:hypothetical protein
MTRSPLQSAFLKGGLAMVAVLGGAAWTSAANAQLASDRYWLEVQAFWPDIDTQVSVSSADGARGTSIDLESDLDLRDRKSLPAIYAGARIGDRWSVIGEYYSLNRSGSASASRDIVFDDVTFPAGVSIASQFDTDVYRLAVGYSFVRNDKADFGVAVGLHATQFTVGLEGQGQVGGAAIQTENRKRDALAPLPTVGVFGSYQVAPKVAIAGRIDYLSLKVSDYDGRLVNAQASVTYRLFKNIGIGAMYRYVDYDLGIEKDRWNGDISYQFKGPAIFLQAAF